MTTNNLSLNEMVELAKIEALTIAVDDTIDISFIDHLLYSPALVQSSTYSINLQFLPIPTTPTQFPRFSTLPVELQLTIWKAASKTAITSGKVVRFDEPMREILSLLSTTRASRGTTMQDYTILQHPGTQNGNSVGAPFTIYLDYEHDVILLKNFNQNPIDRGVALYPNWLIPVKTLTLSVRHVPGQELDLIQSRSIFWTKVSTACPSLEKLITFDREGDRSQPPVAFEFPRGLTPRGLISYSAWWLEDTYRSMHKRGGLQNIELESKVFLSD